MKYFSVSGINHNVMLSPSPEYLIPRSSKSYGAYAPLEVKKISSLDFVWAAPTRTSMTKTIDVDRVIIVPQYISDPRARSAATRTFRGMKNIPHGRRVSFRP